MEATLEGKRAELEAKLREADTALGPLYDRRRELEATCTDLVRALDQVRSIGQHDADALATLGVAPATATRTAADVATELSATGAALYKVNDAIAAHERTRAAVQHLLSRV